MPLPPHPSHATNITDQYDDQELRSVDRAATITWDDVLARLAGGGTFWLTTTVDGAQPHTRPVFAVVADGVLCTATAAGAVKATGLQHGDPVSIATSCEGLDAVWTGTPSRVTDTDALRAVVDAYRQAYGWEVDVDGDSLVAPYGAPTAGPPPYLAFRIDPVTVHAFGTESDLAPRSTRWDFLPTASADPPGPTIVAGHLSIDADARDDYLHSCEAVVRAARAADGCLDFAISADVLDPTRINVYERWSDSSTLAAFRGDGLDEGQRATLHHIDVDEYRIRR